MTYHYVQSTTPLSGKRAQAVSQIILALVEAEGEPIPFTEVAAELGFEGSQSGQLSAAMYALELVGVVDRYSYVEAGGRKPKLAYALATDEVEVEDV